MRSVQSSKVQIAIGGIFSILLAGYFVFFWKSPQAQVGHWKIFKEDSSFRDQIILMDFPNEKRSLGLYQLMRSAIHLAILENNGVSIQQNQIEQEENRINTSTKNPRQLEKIKQIFGPNKEAYRKNFVLPALVDRMIYYDFFLKSEKVHAESLSSTLNFIKEARLENADFHRLAQARNLKIHKLIVSLRKGLNWAQEPDVDGTLLSENRAEAPGIENQANRHRNEPHLDDKTKNERNNEEAQKWYEDVIRLLSVGEVAPAPISREQSWLVAKLIKKSSKEEFELEVVSIPKLDFGQWYEKEKAKIPIEIADKSYPRP